MMTGIIGIFRLLAVCFVIAVFSSGEASAACGKANQKTCNPVFNGGFRCDHGYSSENGICKPCGGRDELACAVARGSGKCQGGLVAVGRYCRSKGCGAVGQRSCDGKCDGTYNQANDAGFCEARGGNLQPRLQGLTFDCRPGFNFDRGPVLRRSSYSDFCQPCGGDGQIVCEAGLGRGLGRCDDGMDLMVRNGRDYCAEGIRGKTKRAMLDALIDHAPVLENLIGITRASSEDAGASLEVRAASQHHINWADGRPTKDRSGYEFEHLKPEYDKLASRLSRTRFQTLTPEADAAHNRPCGSDAFNSWSMGTRVSIPFEGDHEAGFVRRCGPSTPERDTRYYWMASSTNSLGISAGAGVTGAIWVKDVHQTVGRSHGYELSLGSVLDYIKIAKGAEKLADVLKGAASVSPDLSVAVWFDRNSDDRVGALRGISMTVGGSIGLDAGGTYHKATTR